MHLSQTLAREKGYFLNFLFVQFSGFSQEKPFSDTFGPTSQALLEQFSTEELAQASLEDLTSFIQQQGHGGFTDPRLVAASLQRAACPWPCECGSGSNFVQRVWRMVEP